MDLVLLQLKVMKYAYMKNMPHLFTVSHHDVYILIGRILNKMVLNSKQNLFSTISFFGLFLLFSFKFLLFFNYSCLHFLPTHPHHPSQTHCSLPPWFCPCALYSSSWKPLSPLSPPHSPLAIVTLLIKNISNFFSWSSYHCCYSVYIYIYCV